MLTTLKKVSGILFHSGKRLFQLSGATKVVIREDQVGMATQPDEVCRLELGRRLQFQIDQMAALLGRLGQNVDFSRDGALKFASGLAARRQVATIRASGWYSTKSPQLGQP